MTDELSDLRDQYSELATRRQGAEGFSAKTARDLGDKVLHYGTRVAALRAQRDRLMASDTQLANLSVADGADVKLQKLWIELRRLVRFFQVSVRKHIVVSDCRCSVSFSCLTTASKCTGIYSDLHCLL